MLKHGTKIWVLFTEAMWFLFEVNKFPFQSYDLNYQGHGMAPTESLV